MKPIDFAFANKTLGAPDDMPDVVPLRVNCNGEECISCWELDEADLAELNANRKIYLSVVSGITQPPVWLSAACPFITEEDIAQIREKQAEGLDLTPLEERTLALWIAAQAQEAARAWQIEQAQIAD